VIKYVSVVEAKNNFSKLVDELSQGDETVITKHGRPVAKLVPFEKAPIRMGLLEGKLSEWNEADFEKISFDKEWAIWRKKIDKLGK